ncbi:MAG: phage holin family protein [Chloroflexota bacterium]|nr:phage holin family protein [Chloroflexota bacterium]
MTTFSSIIRAIIRFLVVWFIDTISLLATAWILPGISIDPVQNVPTFVVATSAALLLGLVNLLIRPIILLVAGWISWMLVLLVGFFINALALMLTSALLPGFEVSGFWTAFLGGLILSLVNTLMIALLGVNNSESFYENLALRQAARQKVVEEGETTRGLLMIEIDGLSYYHIRKAIQDGWMPNMKTLIDDYGYKISRVDCGLPSTTPACQSGIMHGNNDDIPAFRWLDKESNKMLEGGAAAAEVEPVLSDGNGLLRGGSSIANMFSGDAAKATMTFSKVLVGTKEEKRQRSRDMYMLMRDPYFFMRVLVLFFADVVQELWQYWQQVRKDVQPRLNRLHNGYPILRAAVNIFLRDVGAYFTTLDLVRGAPAIYTLWAGYDELAHHSGPWTRDAMISLKQYDRILAGFLKVIETKAPRPYEFILLSDHGQSFGATFKQRYGLTIVDFVEQQLPEGTGAVATGGGDDGSTPVAAMMHELGNMQDSGVGGRVSNAVASGAQRAIKSNLDRQPGAEEVEPAKVTLCYGGNMANVYFDLYPRKITLNELNAAYPGMVDAVVQHEAIGFVVAYEDDGTPVAFGKSGARNLHTGDVVGEDPLEIYGDVELRSWQVRRVADFSNSGDLIINSTIYPDGTVAALEEMVGSHGGLGGEQTDAFILHPGDMQIPETRNSRDVKAILDARRGLPGTSLKLERPEVVEEVNAWAPATLFKGIGQLSKWLHLAWHAALLSRDAYREIARDVYMTGPALLIALIAQTLQSLNELERFDIVDILVRYGVWFIAILLLWLAARILRGKADYTTTLRVAGFAQSAHLLELLGFIPVIGPLARILALILTLVGVWIGTATANELKGWRTILLPVIYIATVVISVYFIIAVIEGTVLTVDGLLMDFGVQSGQ